MGRVISRSPSVAVYEVLRQASFRHLSVFLVQARTGRARDWASCRRVLASSVLAFFLPRRSPLTRGWGRAAGGERMPCLGCIHLRAARLWRKPSRRPASATARAIRPDNRLSVWRSSRTPTPHTLYAHGVLDAHCRVHPSNERRLGRTPGGRTATLSDSLCSQRARLLSSLTLQAPRVGSYRDGLLRVTPGR